MVITDLPNSVFRVALLQVKFRSLPKQMFVTINVIIFKETFSQLFEIFGLAELPISPADHIYYTLGLHEKTIFFTILSANKFET